MNIKIPLQCFLYFYIPPQDGSIMLTLTSPKQRVMFLMFAVCCNLQPTFLTSHKLSYSYFSPTKLRFALCHDCVRHFQTVHSSNLNKVLKYYTIKYKSQNMTFGDKSLANLL